MSDFYQPSLFDGAEPFRIDKPIRLISMFSGYDSQALALKYLGVPFEHYKTCEWAVPSIQALKDLHFSEDNTDYSATLSKEELVEELYRLGISRDYSTPMREEQIKRLSETKLRQVYNNIKATHNLVSITNVKGKDLEIVDTNSYCYLMTYSFPCQDLSAAGLGKGMSKDSGTRSSLLWEVERILTECEELPQVLLMENVPEVHGSKNVKHFAAWLQFLESIGYKNYWQDLNSKDFGVPQNRNRCFCVSILGDYRYVFPDKLSGDSRFDKRLKHVLEKEVDESYYLSNAIMDCLNLHKERNKANGNSFGWKPANIEANGGGTARCVSTKPDRADSNYVIVGGVRPNDRQ